MIVKDKKEKTWKKMLWVLTYAFLAVNIFLFNVILHEYGHYVAADYYGLNPEIDFEFENVSDSLSFSLESKPIASTSFISNGNDLFIVTVMGPFMNLILGIIFLFYFLILRNYEIRVICTIGFVISFMSFVMNLIPVGGSDGSYIFGLILFSLLV